MVTFIFITTPTHPHTHAHTNTNKLAQHMHGTTLLPLYQHPGLERGQDCHIDWDLSLVDVEFVFRFTSDALWAEGHLH